MSDADKNMAAVNNGPYATGLSVAATDDGMIAIVVRDGDEPICVLMVEIEQAFAISETLRRASAEALAYIAKQPQN